MRRVENPAGSKKSESKSEPLSDEVKEFLKSESNPQSLSDSVSRYIVPYVAQWICSESKGVMLATAINDAITNYKKSLDDLRNAAGRQQEMANETLIGDCETVVNNLVVAIWSLAVDQTVSDRSAQLPMITKDNAKVFFMKLGDDQDQDAGWKVENHLARNAFFNAGRMSLKTTIVVHVLDVIDKGLTEEIKKNPQNPFLEKVSATFFELSNVPKCESGWARNVFFEIRASIYRSENPVSAYYFSE